MGCACLQGAILNPITNLSVNGLFYILGILCYCCVVAEMLHKVVLKDAKEYCHRLRIIFKATLLSLAHFSPIYLVSGCVVTDVLLSIVEFYFYQKTNHKFPKVWLINQFCLNIALTLIIFVPDFIISIVMSSVLIVLSIIVEIVFICKEYGS